MSELRNEDWERLVKENSPMFVAPKMMHEWADSNPMNRSFLVVAADREKCITCGVSGGAFAGAALALEMTENEELRNLVYRAVKTYEVMKDKL